MATCTHTGIIQSPRYPHKYCNNLDCDYTIRMNEGNIIRLSVYSENVFTFDYLAIYGLQGYAGARM
jgi:hypothetical protein